MDDNSLDYTFGLDNPNFSDRTLVLEIILTPPHKGVKRLRRSVKTTPTTAPRKREKTIHVSSLILAGKSLYFRKLFTNGMKESEQQLINIQIEATEEVPFMDLLKHIYSNRAPTTHSALLNLLKMADKFEVESCMRECSGSLLKLPMTPESATLYLDLPSTLVVSLAICPLIEAANKFLVGHFNDLDKYKEEMLKLSLACIESILSNDGLQATSEIDVYDFFLTWARSHYPNLVERQELYKTYLLQLIRFPFIPAPKLIAAVQSCNDIDQQLVSNIFIHALCFNAGSTNHQNHVAGEKGSCRSRQYVERAYKKRPVKVVELDIPPLKQLCIAYLHFTNGGLKCIFPDGCIRSESFHLGREELILSARCSFDKVRNRGYFSLGVKRVGLTAFTVDYTIAVRTKITQEFETLAKGSLNFCERGNTKYVSPMEWTSFMGDFSKYFINGILYVRAEFTMIKS